MHIFDNNDKVAPLIQRSISLQIGRDFARAQQGEIATAEQQESEQHFRRRELLAVEEKAQKDKIIKEHGKNHFKAQVMEKFYSRVLDKVDETFESKDRLFSTTLAIEDAAPQILEVLSLRAASVNRITKLTKTLPWLCTDIVTLVNKPQYRKRADVQVSEPSLAMSYIGLDNLKLIMPTFLLKHWLPNSTAPFPMLKRRLWNDSLSVALAAQKLAQAQDFDDYTAFAAGMLSNIGILTVTRCFLTTHNDMYNRELKQAYEKRDKKLHDVMTEFDSCPSLLLEQIQTRADKVTSDMVELMHFERLAITEAMFDIAYGTSQRNMSPLGKILTKAKAYVAFRNLAKDDMISSDEAKTLLAAAKLTPADIELLKKSDIDHLKLNFK